VRAGAVARSRANMYAVCYFSSNAVHTVADSRKCAKWTSQAENEGSIPFTRSIQNKYLSYFHFVESVCGTMMGHFRGTPVAACGCTPAVHNLDFSNRRSECLFLPITYASGRKQTFRPDSMLACPRPSEHSPIMEELQWLRHESREFRDYRFSSETWQYLTEFLRYPTLQSGTKGSLGTRISSCSE
jgi:hypothetical protein